MGLTRLFGVRNPGQITPSHGSSVLWDMLSGYMGGFEHELYTGPLQQIQCFFSGKSGTLSCHALKQKLSVEIESAEQEESLKEACKY